MSILSQLARLFGIASAADEEDLAAVERRRMAARTAGEIAEDAERAAAVVLARGGFRTCSICDGAGRRKGVLCPACHGERVLRTGQTCEIAVGRRCAACLGTGCRWGRECDVCGGAGVV